MFKIFENRKFIIILNCIILSLFILSIYIVINIYIVNSNIQTTYIQEIAGINPLKSEKSMKEYNNLLVILLDNVEEIQKDEDDVNQEDSNKYIIEENKETETKINLEEQSVIENIRQKEINENNMNNGNNVKNQENTNSCNQSVELNSIDQEFIGFNKIAKIQIPSTNLNIPILDKVTVKGMEKAPCLLYSTGELNKSGNNLIVGHNYQNGKIFSDNEKLQIGDKIYITTFDEESVEYTIYNKFITTPEDVSYLKREIKEQPEITLSCCTDDEIDRIVILAKAEI